MGGGGGGRKAGVVVVRVLWSCIICCVASVEGSLFPWVVIMFLFHFRVKASLLCLDMRSK